MPKERKKSFGVLERVLESTRTRVSILKQARIPKPKKATRSLADSILSAKNSGKRAIISEIKFSSPSKGMISQPSDVNSIAQKMFSAGACGISVLTEPSFFRGDITYLPQIRVQVPLLRKDFIIDELQIAESRHYGADSVLLIVRILGKELKHFIGCSRSFGMEPLVEVHTREEVALALDAGANLLGINNRDMDTLSIDLDTTKKLSKLIPEDKVVVSESGIGTLDDLKTLEKHADAFLVGTSLMQSDDLEGILRKYVGVV